MTPQEAINRIVSIKRHLIQPQLWSRLEIQDMQYALDEAIKALEKQVPKQPQIIANKYPYRYSDVRDDPYDTVCPACGEELDEFEHHCKCGQLIDWSDVE